MQDIQSYLNAMSDSWREERSKYHLTLGGIIDLLKQFPEEAIVKYDKKNDDDNIYPGEGCSYRGYYSDLAFEYSPDFITVRDFLKECQSCLGDSFEGYKGGDFTMTESTPLWAANYGRCGPAIMNAVLLNDEVILITKEID